MLHHYITAYERLNKTESAIFVSLICSLLPENLHSELILSSLQLMLCRVAAVKRLSVYHHNQCRLYIFWSFGIIGLILSQFENRVLLKHEHGQCCNITLLHMNRLNKTESAILFL